MFRDYNKFLSVKFFTAPFLLSHFLIYKKKKIIIKIYYFKKKKKKKKNSLKHC